MRQRRWRLMAAASAALAITSVLPPAMSAAGPAPAVLVRSYAYATVRNAIATYVPALKDRGNLLGAGAATVTHNGPGDYTIDFPGAAIPGETGVAHVSAFGAANRICVLTGYGPVGPDVEVDVICSRPNGIPDDSRFTVTYLAQDGGAQTLAYLYASNPGPNPYVVSTADSYSSVGGPVRVRNLGVGQYRVRLAGLGSSDGDVQVTPLTGGLPRFCEVDSWGNNAGALVADLRCYRPNGVLANAHFTFSWNKQVGLQGDGGVQVAYALGNRPGAAAAYTPAAPTAWNAAGAITIARASAGRYKVTFAGQPSGGTAVVTPYGAAGNRCFVESLIKTGAPVRLYVACVNGAGGAADTRFMVSWLR